MTNFGNVHTGLIDKPRRLNHSHTTSCGPWVSADGFHEIIKFSLVSKPRILKKWYKSTTSTFPL